MDNGSIEIVNLRVVLVEPMYDENIGTVARSMKEAFLIIGTLRFISWFA
jgi:tRNA C32,U32 (ribose-2'-O)-methylase TrmJ